MFSEVIKVLMSEKLLEDLVKKIKEIQSQRNFDENSFLSRDWEFIFSDFDGWLVLHCLTKKRCDGYWVYPMLKAG